MQHSRRLSSAALVLVAFVPLAFSGTPSGASISQHATCHAPRLTGLTVTAARTRARVAGCQLRFVGAALRMPKIQTIRTQSARPGQLAKVVSVSVNPLCPGSTNLGPPPGEPIIKAGATELITGLFIEGGAFIYRSAPVCKDLKGTSSSGTITITNSVGTVLANNMALSAGQLLEVNVQPGPYTVSGVFTGGNTVGPITVNVDSGEVVRQDLVLDVP
jgi:hypothetical protein